MKPSRLALLISCLALAFLHFASAEVAPPAPLPTFSEADLAKWEKRTNNRWRAAMEQFAVLDAEPQDPPGSILLIGSSTFAEWNTAVEDLAPYPVINRGYGGSRYTDHLILIDRLLGDHQPAAIFLYAGNDQLSAETVRDLIVATRERIRAKLPQVPVFIIGARQIPAWPEDNQRRLELGRMTREYCNRVPDTHFVSLRGALMNPDATPNQEWFRGDRIHLTREANVMLGAILKSHFESVTGIFAESAVEDPAVIEKKPTCDP